MEKTLENYYLSKPEPYQGCLLALRHIILSVDPGITTERKFQIPFFYYRGKKIGYLWLNGRKLMVGFCVDKSLLSEVDGVKPKDVYESFMVDAVKDIPVSFFREKIQNLIKDIVAFENDG